MTTQTKIQQAGRSAFKERLRYAELDKIDALVQRLADYRSHVVFVEPDAECDEYQAVLDAAYALTEIDALYTAARELDPLEYIGTREGEARARDMRECVL